MEWNSISYVIQYTTGKLNFCHPFKCIDRGIYKILLYNLCTSKRYTDQIYIVICEGKRKKTNKQNTPEVDRAKRKKNIPEMNNAQSVVNPVAVFTQRKQRS